MSVMVLKKPKNVKPAEVLVKRSSMVILLKVLLQSSLECYGLHYGDGKSFKNWRIQVNKRKDSHRTDNIKISGTCCWKIKSRSGETQIFSPAEDKQPKLAYIARISTQQCSKRKRRCTQETTLKPDLA